MHPSSSSSHYLPAGAYDDLRLPPIRNSSHPSASSSRYMEPPAHTSSSLYPRNTNVTLPPLVNPRHTTFAPPNHASDSASRHVSSHHTPLPSTSSSQPHPSYHQSRRASLSTYPQPAQTTSHHSSTYYTHGGHHDPVSPSSSSSSAAVAGGAASRTFSCDICGTTFSRAYDCKRHRDIHTRQGGHECPYCRKSLSRADALKRHMERGCSGAGFEDEDLDNLERDQERRDKRDRRHSASADPGNSKYYYTSSRHR